MNYLDVQQGAKTKNQTGSIVIWLILLGVLASGAVWYFKAKHAKDKVVHKAEEVVQASKELKSKVADKVSPSTKEESQQKEGNKK